MSWPVALGKSVVRAIVRSTYRVGVPYVHSRQELPFILNARGLVGEGAEIGVREANYSVRLLEEWKGLLLHSIDPWKHFGKDEYVDVSNRQQSTQERNYQTSCSRLARFGDRSKVMRCTSEEAAPRFEDAQLSFVYIDAQHHYEAVKEDIALWRPKIRKGGVLAGHDYLDGEIEGAGRFGVRSAVDEFVAERGVKKLVITHEREWPTWIAFL